MTVKFSNFASATLAASITSASTSITVTTGQGALFPSLSAGEYFFAVLTDSSNNVEVVKITSRSGDTLVAVRAQESTTARAYAAADKIELRLTAAALNAVGTDATAAATALLQILHPVGSIYSSTVSTNPGTLFGFGTWVSYASGRVMIGDGGGFVAGATGGSADAIAVAHTHTFSATSSGQSNTHSHSASDGGHAHYYAGSVSTSSQFPVSGGGGYPGVGTPYMSGANTATGYASISVGNANADHSHSVSGTTGSTGASGTNANLQPYVVVYMWNRIA